MKTLCLPGVRQLLRKGLSPLYLDYFSKLYTKTHGAQIIIKVH